MIDERVRALSLEKLMVQFHELVDKRLLGTLTYIEEFELERIEARLDREDQTEYSHLQDEQNTWRTERAELIASIEQLLGRIKTAG
ncbi:MAG TPA: hypothetical protein VMU80_19290 [Bryobacteraceae bacterium]|nr:hypothetical protein [Bryobacteraceae bacterium]